MGGHDYDEFSGGPYFKYEDDGHSTTRPIFDQSVSYQKLYCRKCGDTIEVVAREHSKKGSDS